MSKRVSLLGNRFVGVWFLWRLIKYWACSFLVIVKTPATMPLWNSGLRRYRVHGCQDFTSAPVHASPFRQCRRTRQSHNAQCEGAASWLAKGLKRCMTSWVWIQPRLGKRDDIDGTVGQAGHTREATNYLIDSERNIICDAVLAAGEVIVGLRYLNITFCRCCDVIPTNSADWKVWKDRWLGLIIPTNQPARVILGLGSAPPFRVAMT